MSARNYDLAYLKEISGGDKDFILDMIQTFLSTAPEEIAELKQLANDGQWTRLGESAHKFAPSLQFLGINSVRPIINQIEDLAFANKQDDSILPLVLKLEDKCLQVLDELKVDFNI